MKKWVELTRNAMMNFCMALIAGGVLKLALDTQSIVSSIVTIICGAYLFFGLALIGKNIEEKD